MKLIFRKDDNFAYLYDDSMKLLSTHMYSEYRINENDVCFILNDVYAGRVFVTDIEWW
jgi:hypothetical protein